MTTYRAELTHFHPGTGHLMWITRGYTREEALYRMRQFVHRWVVTTGNPWPTGGVEIVEVAETDTPDAP